MTRGYCGIVMYQPKTSSNWGSLMRTADILNVNFIATIGQRFPKQAADTLKSWRHTPTFQFDDIDDLCKHLPYSCHLVGIELTPKAIELKDFSHPERAVYLLGAEDNGLPNKVLDKCHGVVKLRGGTSMNVSCAGSIVLYHRLALRNLDDEKSMS